MKQRSFYIILLILIFLDSVLLASPNLLGKLGILIYKYYYLKTFSRTLVTVSLVCGSFTLVTFLIQWLVERLLLKRNIARFFLFLLLIFVIGVYAKVIIDFSSWSYSHTGWRFKLGAYLLPLIVMYIIIYTIATLKHEQFPLKETEKEIAAEEPEKLTED